MFRPRMISFYLSDKLIYLAAAISEYLADLFGKTTIFNKQKAREITQRAWVCEAKRARLEFGFQSKVTLLEGISQTADWYRTKGWF